MESDSSSSDPSSTSSPDLGPADRLLFECLRLPAAEQAEALERLCGEHTEHEERLRRWFRLLRDVGFADEVTPASDTLPRQFGEYRLLRRLGRGGMGLVYLAEQPRLGRKVALKLIQLERLGLPTVRDRFQREALAISKLDHPGICAVFDVGESNDVPYIAMRYVEGETLADKIAQATEEPVGRPRHLRLPAFEAVEDTRQSSGSRETLRIVALIEKLARALHAAHEVGLVHRDVKPSNVMVTPDGEPVLLDFGLARAEDTAGPKLTLSGDLVGTPAYMSPEQILGQRPDRRTDVYSLGVTLCECLTLSPPFAAENRETLYRRILAGDFEAPARHSRHVPSDLLVVVEKALERDRDRRYATALELAEDLRRVRRFEPIHARRAGPLLRLRRWTQRNPFAATFLALLTAGLAVSLFLLDLVGAEQRATQRALVDVRALGLAAESRGVRDSNPMLAVLLARDAVRLRPELPETVSSLQSALASLHERAVLPHDDAVFQVQVSPKGDRILTASKDGRARLWRSEGLWIADLRHEDSVPRAAFSPDGDLIVTVSEDHTARLFDGNGNPVHAPLVHDDEVVGVFFSPDGQSFLTGTNKKAILWSRSGDKLAELPNPEGFVVTASFTSSGLIATGVGYRVDETDGSFPVRIWKRTDTGVELQREFFDHHGLIWTVEFSPDGERIVSASSDRTARVFSFADKKSWAFQHADELRHATFSHDGTRVLTCSLDGTAKLWDAGGVGPPVVLQHGGGVSFGCFFADDTRILTVSRDQKARIWDLSGALLTTLSGHADDLKWVAVTTDGQWVLTASADATARIWATENQSVPTLRGEGKALNAAFFPDGKRVFAAFTHEIVIWNLNGATLRKSLRQPLSFACLSAEGQRVLLAGRDRVVRVVDVHSDGGFRDTGTSVSVPEDVTAASFSPLDARTFAVAGVRGHVYLRRPGHSELLQLSTGHAEGWYVRSVAFSHDGARLLTSSADQSVCLHARADHGVFALAEVLPSHRLETLFVCFSPDGSSYLTASADRTARLRRIAAGPDEFVEFLGHDGAVTSAVLSRDGKLVVTASKDGTARLWDASGRLRSILRGHDGPVVSARFSFDSRRVVTASRDGSVRIWWTAVRDLERIAERLSRGRSYSPTERARFAELLEDR